MNHPLNKSITVLSNEIKSFEAHRRRDHHRVCGMLQLGPWSNPPGIDRPEGGLNTQSPHAPHALTLLASLASDHSPHSHASLLASASLPASPALLASLAPRLCWPALSLRLTSSLPPRLLASLTLPAARFARPASPAARSARRLSCFPPSFRSGHFSSLRSPPRLLCSRFALQLACCSLRSPPRLPLASLAAGCSASCSLRSPSTC